MTESEAISRAEEMCVLPKDNQMRIEDFLGE